MLFSLASGSEPESPSLVPYSCGASHPGTNSAASSPTNSAASSPASVASIAQGHTFGPSLGFVVTARCGNGLRFCPSAVVMAGGAGAGQPVRNPSSSYFTPTAVAVKGPLAAAPSTAVAGKGPLPLKAPPLPPPTKPAAKGPPPSTSLTAVAVKNQPPPSPPAAAEVKGPPPVMAPSPTGAQADATVLETAKKEQPDSDSCTMAQPSPADGSTEQIRGGGQDDCADAEQIRGGGDDGRTQLINYLDSLE